MVLYIQQGGQDLEGQHSLQKNSKKGPALLFGSEKYLYLRMPKVYQEEACK